MVTRVLSGMRPTGRLHIGNMVGALDNWLDLQNKYDSNFFVADWHALTTEKNTKNIRRDTIEMVKDWLAYGIDPNKSNLFIQSQVPQHAELHLILSMLAGLPRLERLPDFKGHLKTVLGITDPERELTTEEVAKAKSSVNYGFLGYPVLMAADILLYKADGVPVGNDQDSHVEFAREIARTFNSTFGYVFPEPEQLYTLTPRILGTDGRKMSKSSGNIISPTDSAADITSKVKKMLIDPARQRRDIPGNPTLCSVYDLHEAYTADEREIEIGKLCASAGIGCSECKTEAAQSVAKNYEGYADKRAYWDGKESEVLDILRAGSEKARNIASKTMQEVKSHLLFDY